MDQNYVYCCFLISILYEKFEYICTCMLFHSPDLIITNILKTQRIRFHALKQLYLG